MGKTSLAPIPKKVMSGLINKQTEQQVRLSRAKEQTGSAELNREQSKAANRLSGTNKHTGSAEPSSK